MRLPLGDSHWRGRGRKGRAGNRRVQLILLGSKARQANRILTAIAKRAIQARVAAHHAPIVVAAHIHEAHAAQ